MGRGGDSHAVCGKCLRKEIFADRYEHVDDHAGTAGIGDQLVGNPAGDVVGRPFRHRPGLIPDAEFAAPFEERSRLDMRVGVPREPRVRGDPVEDDHHTWTVGENSPHHAREDLVPGFRALVPERHISARSSAYLDLPEEA